MNLEIVVRVICLCQEAYLPTCKKIIRKKVFSFFNVYRRCIARLDNATLRSIMNSDTLYTSLWRHWQKMLYVYSY